MRSRHPYDLVTAVLLVALVALPAALPAAEGGSIPGAELARSPLVDPALLEALATHERVGVRVYFLDLDSQGSSATRTVSGREVSPTLLDLAGAFVAGELRLDTVDSVHAVLGVVDAEAVRSLLGRPSVLGIELDPTVSVEPEGPSVSLRATCSSSSTRACVQGNRFGIQVYMASAYATVAASSSQSAVFWRYSSSNWEVVAKVLNGCSINGYWWVFAAGATTSGYTLRVNDYSSGGSIAYNGAALCPIADTGMYNTFPCP